MPAPQRRFFSENLALLRSSLCKLVYDLLIKTENNPYFFESDHLTINFVVFSKRIGSYILRTFRLAHDFFPLQYTVTQSFPPKNLNIWLLMSGAP